MFSKRKNKSFNYKSRFSKDGIKQVEPSFDVKQEMNIEFKSTRKTGAGKRKIGLPLLLLLLGIIIAIMYYLEYKIL